MYDMTPSAHSHQMVRFQKVEAISPHPAVKGELHHPEGISRNLYLLISQSIKMIMKNSG